MCNEDINECQDHMLFNCTNSNCSNTLGGYECVCWNNYFKNSTNNQCQGQLLKLDFFKIAVDYV